MTGVGPQPGTHEAVRILSKVLASALAPILLGLEGVHLRVRYRLAQHESRIRDGRDRVECVEWRGRVDGEGGGGGRGKGEDD